MRFKRMPFGMAVCVAIMMFFGGFIFPPLFIIALIDFLFLIPGIKERKEIKKEIKRRKAIRKEVREAQDKLMADHEECCQAFLKFDSHDDKEKYEAVKLLWNYLGEDDNKYLASFFKNTSGDACTSSDIRIMIKKFILEFISDVSKEYYEPVDKLFTETNRKVGSVN